MGRSDGLIRIEKVAGSELTAQWPRSHTGPSSLTTQEFGDFLEGCLKTGETRCPTFSEQCNNTSQSKLFRLLWEIKL